MPTQKQTRANRANSKRSTGPKTAAGKTASSQNSWQHGLTFGVFRVLAREDQSLYEALLQQLLTEYKPATATESILVERMAQHHWLRNRALYFQSHYIENGDHPKLSLFMRYETMHERAYSKCLSDLLKLRAARQKEEIGFDRQTHKQEVQRLDLLRREADINYQETRNIGSDLSNEPVQQRTQTEAPTQKAA
jgi:hypothetical protein